MVSQMLTMARLAMNSRRDRSAGLHLQQSCRSEGPSCCHWYCGKHSGGCCLTPTKVLPAWSYIWEPGRPRALLLQNRVGNAIQHCPEGGTYSATPGCWSKAQRRLLLLCIEDSGAGVPADRTRSGCWNVFLYLRRFFRAGLGLIHSAARVERHPGGNIELDGTAFSAACGQHSTGD